MTGDSAIDIVSANDVVSERGDVDFLLTDSSLTSTVFADASAIRDSLVSIESAVLRGGDSDNTLDASAFSGDVRLVGLGGNDSLPGIRVVTGVPSRQPAAQPVQRYAAVGVGVKLFEVRSRVGAFRCRFELEQCVAYLLRHEKYKPRRNSPFGSKTTIFRCE